MRGDSEESSVQALEPPLHLRVGGLTPIHFQEVAGGGKRLVDSQRVSASNAARKREGGQTMGSRRFLAGFVKFALQVLLGDLHIAQGHPQGRVAEQLHQCREADPEPEHLGRKRMAKTMGSHVSGATGPPGSLGECKAERMIQSMRTTPARQEEALGPGELERRGQGPQSEDTSHNPPYLGIGRNQAFGVEFAEGDQERPLAGPDFAQAVERQVDTFAKTDSGSADEQEGIRFQIVDSPQLLLQECIIVGRKRSGQAARLPRDVFTTNESRLKGRVLGSQIVQQATEKDEMSRTGRNVQRSLLSAQRAEPAEQMRVAAELGGTADPWESSSKISEEAANGRSILVHGARAQGKGEGLEVLF